MTDDDDDDDEGIAYTQLNVNVRGLFTKRNKRIFFLILVLYAFV